MNKVTLSELKSYIGLDGEEDNKLLGILLSSSEHVIEKVLREPITKKTPEIVKTAVLFVAWQLYFHRDNAEFDMITLENTVATMLSDLRKERF